jgi:hypothetical protein
MESIIALTNRKTCDIANDLFRELSSHEKRLEHRKSIHSNLLQHQSLNTVPKRLSVKSSLQYPSHISAECYIASKNFESESNSAIEKDRLKIEIKMNELWIEDCKAKIDKFKNESSLREIISSRYHQHITHPQFGIPIESIIFQFNARLFDHITKIERLNALAAQKEKSHQPASTTMDVEPTIDNKVEQMEKVINDLSSKLDNVLKKMDNLSLNQPGPRVPANLGPDLQRGNRKRIKSHATRDHQQESQRFASPMRFSKTSNNNTPKRRGVEEENRKSNQRSPQQSPQRTDQQSPQRTDQRSSQRKIQKSPQRSPNRTDVSRKRNLSPNFKR